jgi:hypothetical protein
MSDAVRPSAEERLRDAHVNPHDPNLKDWPSKPSGTAARSERGGGIKLDATARVLPEVVVYEHIDFGGAEWRTNLNYSWVGSWWNDRISSIIVVTGTWRFYEHKDFQGRHWDLGPGY